MPMDISPLLPLYHHFTRSWWGKSPSLQESLSPDNQLEVLSLNLQGLETFKVEAKCSALFHQSVQQYLTKPWGWLFTQSDFKATLIYTFCNQKQNEKQKKKLKHNGRSEQKQSKTQFHRRILGRIVRHLLYIVLS